MYKGILSENNILLGFINDPDNIVDNYIEVSETDYNRFQNLKHDVEFLKYKNNQFVLVTNQAKANQIEIMQLKQQLADTDYKAIKYAEGLISAEDYEPIKQQRQAWRDEINELEQEV